METKKNVPKGAIFEIKRFAVHDGDGIRTTVFFKGCPLKCVWCHNPESIDFKPQTAYYGNKCIGCGECIGICPNNAQKFENGLHIFNRDLCLSCGKCADVCLGNALMTYGKSVTVNELMPLLLEDKEFYESSDGGVTLSGGECLMQAEFCAELLKELKANGINTAVDTSGFVVRSAIDKVIDYTDIFLYDIKAFDRDVHIKCTGKPNEIILENLKYIDSLQKATEIRIPYVPGFNDGEMQKIADFVKTLKYVKAVKVLPYHNFAASKYKSLGMENTLPRRSPKTAQSKKQKHFSGWVRLARVEYVFYVKLSFKSYSSLRSKAFYPANSRLPAKPKVVFSQQQTRTFHRLVKRSGFIALVQRVQSNPNRDLIPQGL